MSFLDFFSNNHVEARGKFLLAASGRGAVMESHMLGTMGPDGEELATDVAYLGPRTPTKLLVLLSGTHGLEGLCGSGCLTGWLHSSACESLPINTGVLLVNFVNPYGVAWQRRGNELNIDLNRNFVDHNGPRPQNEGYERLHDDLVCQDVDADAANVRLRAESDRDKRGYIEAVIRGQYTHPDGMFFGGTAPAWSNTTLRTIIGQYAMPAEIVAVIDYHTGMGPFGYGTPITMHGPEESGLDLALKWYGRSICAPKLLAATGAISDDTPTAEGYLQAGIEASVAGQVVYIAIEYGTFDLEKFIAACRADCRLFAWGDPLSAAGLEVRMQNQEFFYPRTDDWLEMIWTRSNQVTRQAIQGLSAFTRTDLRTEDGIGR